MPDRFSPDEIARLDRAREVELETRSAVDGRPHRAVVWIVVDAGEAYVRSWRGATARWYREIRAAGTGRLIVDGDAIPIEAALAPEPDVIDVVSRGFERKYAGDPSTPDMVRSEVLDTTLRLHPA